MKVLTVERPEAPVRVTLEFEPGELPYTIRELVNAIQVYEDHLDDRYRWHPASQGVLRDLARELKVASQW